MATVLLYNIRVNENYLEAVNDIGFILVHLVFPKRLVHVVFLIL